MNLVATATGRVIERVKHEITDAEQHVVTQALAARGIHVAPVIDVFRTLHLWALKPVTTVQEVQALAAFHEVTDARIAWHPPTGEVAR